MIFGPYKNTQALDYATFEGNGCSIRRVAYTEGNQPPIAALRMAKDATTGKEQPNYGDAEPNTPDFQMNFDAFGTRDPEDNEMLEYVWDFDGSGTVDETTSPSASRTYAERGKYTVTSRVEDSLGWVSEPARIDVFPGNRPPEPAVDQIPAEFRVGEPVTASGTATDPDGDAPVTLSWQAVRSHDGNHGHTLKSAEASGSLTFEDPRRRACTRRARTTTTWSSGSSPPTRWASPRPSRGSCGPTRCS